MRLDKFLKVSRIIKRRTVARDFADNDRVTVNDRIAKPSTEVKVGDIITIRVGSRMNTYQIISIQESVKTAEAKDMYKVIE